MRTIARPMVRLLALDHPGALGTWRVAAVVSVGLLAATLVTPLRPRAANAPDPKEQVKATVDKVLSILSDPALKANPQARRQQLKDTVAGHFDFAEMARSALGYHWRDLSEQQRKDFVGLFTRFIEAAYIGKVESYSGQQIDYVKDSRDDADYARVATNVIQQGKEPIGINYRLKLEDGEWKVYDVAVDNISITANYRNQFNRVINNKGFDALMDQMRAKQEGLDQDIAK
jgi:phospholipid transport system substrate-binding protein